MLGKLISRNLKLYFRDITAVFFSLLSVIIVVVLFVLFLTNNQIDSVMEATNHSISENKVSYLVHSWILSGLLSITTISSVLGGFESMVNDREKKIIMAFKSSPIKAWVYPFVNVICAFIIGVIISTLTLVIYTACIYFITGYILPLDVLLYSFGLILFSSLMNAFIFGCVCSFFKTNSAFSSASILVGTVIGFINGLYVPIGSLSETIVNFLCFFPSLHIATIFRRVITTPAMNEVFGNAPNNVIEQYRTDYGLKLFFDGTEIEEKYALIYAGVFGLICLILMILSLKKKKKEI